MSQEELRTRLLQSASVSSLASEQEVVKRLGMLGWSVSHGSFFVDPNTRKSREMDVTAHRSWQRDSKSGEQLAVLNLLVEVKSIRGYHLVFAPLSSSLSSYSRADSTQREWAGYASDRRGSRNRIGSILSNSGVKLEMIPILLDKFHDMAYPEGYMAVRQLVVDSPTAPFVSSAFRETNIGGEKTLENSVLWKATQTLNSVMTESHNYLSEGLFEDIESAIYYAGWQGLDVFDSILDELTREVRRIRFYQPIVVVDAMLWALDDRKLRELPWCRFCQLDRFGLSTTWYDVVQTAFLNDYLQEVTSHYDEQMRIVGAERS